MSKSLKYQPASRLIGYARKDLKEQNTFASEAHEISAKSAKPATPAK
jgi:hypothetical protein